VRDLEFSDPPLDEAASDLSSRSSLPKALEVRSSVSFLSKGSPKAALRIAKSGTSFGLPLRSRRP